MSPLTYAGVTPGILSVTVMFDSVTFPVFVTSYVQVTVDPTSTTGPVGVSASTPFVFFSSTSPGAAPK